MSQHHHDPVEENIETHPVKLTIAVVIGAVGLVIGIMLIASFAVSSHRVGETDAKSNTPEAITKNVAPVVMLAIDPSKSPAPSTGATVTSPTPATSKSTGIPIVAMAIPGAVPAGVTMSPAGGEGVYKAACVACHAAGVAGAPKLGDKGAWNVRIAKGKATLYDHSLKGFNAMPAKGGNSSLSEADVKAAVDYMIAQAK